ncbi:MAG: Spy/CpxP family protein refolding chaperone [Xenococcaceae cyanobacterium]
MKLKYFALLFAIFSTFSIDTEILQAQQPSQERTSRMEKIGLTTEQKDRVAQIRNNTRQQIEGILTDEQKSQYQNEIAAGKKPREAMRSANLSAEQKEKIKGMMRSQREQISQLLTPEQKQKLREQRARKS